MRPLKSGCAKPNLKQGGPVLGGFLLDRQALTARLKWQQIPLNVGRQAATAEPVRVRPSLIYILGVPSDF